MLNKSSFRLLKPIKNSSLFFKKKRKSHVNLEEEWWIGEMVIV